MEIPPNLVHAVQQQSAVLFLGAGASFGATHPAGLKIPSGIDLRDKLSTRFLGGALKDRPLATVAEYAINESSLIEVQQFVRDEFREFQPAEFHKLIPTFGWHGIAGTNYDLIVERAYESAGAAAVQSVVPFVKNGQPIDKEMKRHLNGVQYLKLHGCLSSYSDSEIPFILATEQYVKYNDNRTRLFGRIREWGTEFPIVFCGYSIADPNIQNILFDLFSLERRRPTYYMVAKDIDDIEARYWQSHRIVPLKGTFEEFLTSLDVAVAGLARSLPIAAIGGGTTTIRKHFQVSGVVETALLTSFLANDVDHVRPGMPVDGIAPAEFYKGSDEGWAGIAQSLDVDRTVTDTLVVDAILTDETARSAPVELFVLKGPGGNGKTITLKRAAWMAANDYSKLVLYSKPGGSLNPTVIEEISEHVGERFFLFVDKAALRVEELETLIREASGKNIKLTIITAERDAEWNVRCGSLESFVTKDIPVRYLSEKEIRGLLAKLSEHSALGLLASMAPEDQVRVFMERAQRQLLVALHEVTLGKPFEDIVYDEYHRIIPNDAQKLYLDICTLNRLGVEVRAGLISRISGIGFTDFKSGFFRPLEHIVQSRFDQYIGDYVYSARHQRVAEMVFDRVLSKPEERFDQIIYVMKGMNIDYSSDSKAFSQLVRGRGVAEAFPSYELGRRIYDTAEEIAGEEAFLLQQRAIFEMDHSGGSLDSADRYLSAARVKQPYNPSIRHTSANLLRRQANETPNSLLKQNLRDRAKTLLRSAMGKAESEPYAYYTAGQLALDQLRDVLHEQNGQADTAAERLLIDLARDVEAALADGLQRFSQNEHLLALEASYRVLMNQHQRAEAALLRAFERNPRLDWIANRLARSYIEQGRNSEAGAVLQKAVQENPSSKTAHFNIARFFMDHGTPDERRLVVDHLRRAFTKGDMNYDAQFWYARELFLTGDYDSAAEAFSTLARSTMSARAKNSVRGLVGEEAGQPMQYVGTVQHIEEAYLFVKSADFPSRIFAHRSRIEDFEWSKLNRDTKVTFGVGFNAKGPVAVNLSPR